MFFFALALARFDLISTIIFHYPLSSILLLKLLLLFYGVGVGVGSFKLNQHNHFSLPTVLNTLAQTLASFLWLLALAPPSGGVGFG